MLSTIITLLSGFLGIFWSVKARNSFTKLTGVLLAISAIGSVISYGGIHLYAFYAQVLFCLMAAYEPLDSTRLKKTHRVYFALSGFLMALVVLDFNLKLPFTPTLWPFVIVFILATIWFLVQEAKMVRTRLCYISIWLGLGLVYLISAI